LQGVIAQRLIPSVDKKRRVLATEVLLPNNAVRAIIREGRLHQLYNILSTSRSAGMHTMEDSLADLYRQGEITLDNAYAASAMPERLESLLEQ
ncbi:MAG: type IV pili twitching motility protein PilT, partial [Planctomycetota bacterium]